MIVFAANFIPLFMINYWIFFDKSVNIFWMTLLEIYILYLINYNYG
jgi:hypothetical protein